MNRLHRFLFCPVCGAKLLVDVADYDLAKPEAYRLPEHVPATNVNLCCALVVTVTLDYDRCSKCGATMVKHPSGVCRGCFRG